MFTTNCKLRATNYKGFTLIEVVVSVFIFLVIMMLVSQIFISAFRGYNYAKIVQQDTAAAQFAVNTMAKELRTSSVVDTSSDFVRFYEHSQAICIQYQISSSGTELQVARYTDPATMESEKQQNCQSHSFSSGNFSAVASGIKDGRFQAYASVKASPKSIGKVTISLRIGEGDVHQARIQTTVSLRDYGSIEM